VFVDPIVYAVACSRSYESTLCNRVGAESAVEDNGRRSPPCGCAGPDVYAAFYSRPGRPFFMRGSGTHAVQEITGRRPKPLLYGICRCAFAGREAGGWAGRVVSRRGLGADRATCPPGTAARAWRSNAWLSASHVSIAGKTAAPSVLRTWLQSWAGRAAGMEYSSARRPLKSAQASWLLASASRSRASASGSWAGRCGRRRGRRSPPRRATRCCAARSAPPSCRRTPRWRRRPPDSRCWGRGVRSAAVRPAWLFSTTAHGMRSWSIAFIRSPLSHSEPTMSSCQCWRG
jgi:hypothetical protein